MQTNQALRFILPMLSMAYMRDNFFLNKYFVGCFIEDKHMQKFQGKILLAYKFSLSLDFITFNNKLSEHPYFLKDMDYDYDDEGIVIYVFNVPKEYLQDYYLILEGNYSEISSDLKLKILKFWGDSSNQSLLHSILFKGERIKDYWVKQNLNPMLYCTQGEYWYKPHIINEAFDIDSV